MTENLDFVDSGAGAFTFLTKELGRQLETSSGSLYREDMQVMEDVDLLTRMKKPGNFKFITEACLYTSKRRFIEEGYLKCMFEDTIHGLNSSGKTRNRWQSFL